MPAPLPTLEQCVERINANLAANSLKSLKSPPQDRPIRIYADGIFDVFHFGHARALQQAKNLFPQVVLIVGCCNDAITHALKGKTVMNEEERYESLRHCTHVDEIVENAPWIMDEEFLTKHQIDYVTHDVAPYASAGCDDVYGFLKSSGRFIPTERTEGISTSDLILRIVREYDEFVNRNLKRGYKRQDMNVSFLKEKQIQLKEATKIVENQIEAIQENINNNVEIIAGNVQKLVQRSEKFFEDMVSSFKKGSLVSKFKSIFSSKKARTAASGSASLSSSAALAANHGDTDDDSVGGFTDDEDTGSQGYPSPRMRGRSDSLDSIDAHMDG